MYLLPVGLAFAWIAMPSAGAVTPLRYDARFQLNAHCATASVAAMRAAGLKLRRLKDGPQIEEFEAKDFWLETFMKFVLTDPCIRSHRVKATYEKKYAP
jgi:hypothetical protein